MSRYPVIALLCLPALSLADDNRTTPPDAQHEQRLSSHFTSCKPGENVLSNVTANSQGGYDWIATCNGTSLRCHTMIDRKNPHNEGVTCRPESH
jgi:superoxide dismutase